MPSLNELKFKFRENKLLRILAYPYMSLQLLSVKKKYLKSNYPEMIKGFKDKYKGQRCFIIGNGPSLRLEDIEKLSGEITFAANRIYELFDKTKWRPSFWICVDPYFIDEIKHDHDFLSEMKQTEKFVSAIDASKEIFAEENVYFIFNNQPFRINKTGKKLSVPFSDDASILVESGDTVTYTSIQLAAYMGFSEIYLLGVDFSYSIIRRADGKIYQDNSVKDYFTGTKYFSTILNYDAALMSYYSAKGYCDSHGIKICNATRGGKLEVFERVDFDEVIGGRH